MVVSINTANRLGFAVLGLTNNFAYVIMLSAAYDLLNNAASSATNPVQYIPPPADANNNLSSSLLTIDVSQQQQQQQQMFTPITNVSQQHKYCNEHSTSTILLADTIPSLATKFFYPFLFVGIPTAHKATATALLSAAAFIITGLSSSQLLIFTGVICASFSSGLGESTYLSNTPLYGDVSLSGWSMGTGAAGLLGAMAYALLRMVLSIRLIMIVMLVIPICMILAYFYVIRPIDTDKESTGARQQSLPTSHINVISPIDLEQQHRPIKHDVEASQIKSYGVVNNNENLTNHQPEVQLRLNGGSRETSAPSELFNFSAKIRYLPSLAKYFLPLLLVYFAEYFINQGLFELIYYPEISFLDHAAQYRWFQVSYQLGVMISRSSLDLIQIKNIWAMSLLQALNALLFLAHASKLIHIPSFYLVILLIIYEGLLGGFTYVNAFYRVKKELRPERQEFGISAVTLADSLGIVMAGLVALPVHNALCKLYM